MRVRIDEAAARSEAATGPALDLVARPPSPGDVGAALAFARGLGAVAPLPGSDATATLWEALATLAAHDLGVARAVEPHLDALAILDQAGDPALPGRLGASHTTWGVFASEGGPDPVRLVDGAIHGVKQWCSLAGLLDAALVTAAAPAGTAGDEERMLVAVDLRGPGVEVADDDWHARGLAEIPSGAVRFAGAPATPVGGPGFYLGRPGFAWGGIGVAACWYGGAVGVARSVFDAAVRRPDRELLLAHLGAIDEQLVSARLALAAAAAEVDAGAADGGPGRLLAARTRGTVARVAEDVLRRAGHALGPAPLAKDPVHAKRVADLGLYLRQHHAEADDASLGARLVRDGGAPW